MSSHSTLTDSFGRVIRDLRVSITDRCNFRCLYCLPETEEAANFYRSKFDRLAGSDAAKPIVLQWKPRQEILSFEEISRVIRIFVSLGVDKVRLTGGEPLLRRGIDRLIRDVSAIPGLRDLALTTNGFQFAEHADALKEAGLKRISFSMDSLDRDNFKKMTGRDGLEQVLAGIARAKELGLTPVKVNAVVIRGINDHEIEALADFARRERISFRFIEFMPLDSRHAWQKEFVVSGAEILSRLKQAFTLEPVVPSHAAETARRWRFADSEGEIGIIAPVSEPFCGHCNRVRVTADGKIRTCLFSLGEHDMKPLLRGGASDSDIARWLEGVILQKEARHHIGETEFVQPERSMSCIGG